MRNIYVFLALILNIDNPKMSACVAAAEVAAAAAASRSCVLTVQRYLTREKGCVCETQVIPTGSATATGGQFGYHLQSLQANFITSTATISTHDNVLLDQRR